MTDPSGNYSGWKATCIGQNNGAGKGILKADYAEGLSIPAATKLAVKVHLSSSLLRCTEAAHKATVV